jgi:hypothetical protein
MPSDGPDTELVLLPSFPASSQTSASPVRASSLSATCFSEKLDGQFKKDKSWDFIDVAINIFGNTFTNCLADTTTIWHV